MFIKIVVELFVMLEFKLQKKGAGDAVSTLILFIAVLGISIGVIAAFQQFANSTQSSVENKQEVVINKLDTELSILQVTHNSTANITTAYIKNIGKTDVSIDLLNFFIGSNFISNSTIVDANTGDSSRILLTQDIIQVNLTQPLSSGVNELIVATEYGNTFSKKFNVE